MKRKKNKNEHSIRSDRSIDAIIAIESSELCASSTLFMTPHYSRTRQQLFFNSIHKFFFTVLMLNA